MFKEIIFSSILVLLLFTGCDGIGGSGPEALEAKDFRTQTAEGMYQIDLAKYMKRATDLNVDASLQFQNIFKETYIAIIDEDKNEYVDVYKELGEYDESLTVAGNYRKIQMDYFMEEMTVLRRIAPKQVTINGLDAEQVEFSGRVPDVDYDIFYLMTFIEGKDNVYMMMQWTLSENEGTYKNTFYQSANTFKEL